ncbi:cytochrome P450 [Periconia macrospinosa]|uniref:Cytochrome P450 n=1 Tax=Periconia macrospinosa TaxID=97972 RepID=A0A2V1DUF8_9PLEO|nr:cytochrome P450 [Periconia macrospinosa]
MMAPVPVLSFFLATIAFVPFLAIKLRPRIARWKAMRHNGCQEPPSYPHKDHLGQDLHKISMEAYKQRRFLDLNEELFEKYGPTFKTINNGKVWIKTKDARLSKAVYATFFEKFGMEPIRYEKGGFFGDGILVTDGARWKHSRGLIRPAFEMAHIANFDRLHRHVNRFLEILPSDGSTVDLLPLFKRLTLDLSMEFIFGRPMNALQAPDLCTEFLDAFQAAQKGVVMNPAARDKEWQSCCDVVHRYLDERVEEAIARVSKANDSLEESKYVRLIDEMAKVTTDRSTLRYQILSVFSPAHDTVAVTLGNLFFHLARNQSVWSSNRECLETCILPIGGGIDGNHPVFVEKGTVLETNFRCMQRNKEYWGEDAEDFKPQRWESARPTWEYTPFSGGPRICPAFKLVYMECEYITASLLRRFSKLELRDPELRWVEERRLIYQSRNGTLVGLVQ